MVCLGKNRNKNKQFQTITNTHIKLTHNYQEGIINSTRIKQSQFSGLDLARTLRWGSNLKEANKLNMDGMQNWTNYLEVMRNRLLIVNDADSLIAVLKDVKSIPIALSTIEDVTDGTGLNMSLSVISSEVKIVNRVMCLSSDDMFTTVQLNLDTIKTIQSKISVDQKGVVMKLVLKNGAEFLLMFHTDLVEDDQEE